MIRVLLGCLDGRRGRGGVIIDRERVKAVGIEFGVVGWFGGDFGSECRCFLKGGAVTGDGSAHASAFGGRAWRDVRLGAVFG